ncbi:TPA: winged helix-turn-helix transcriptional regulator [Clostridioides difficile]|nr:winged helix-turn-helix transcriptional regulator [Clostridioides difficile]
MIVIEFSDKEEESFKETLEWLSKNFSVSPSTIQKGNQDFIFNPFTRSVVNKNGNFFFLTSKEFDLLYFLYLHRGQVFTKEQLYENVWGFKNMPLNTSNLPSFIRKLRKKIEPDPDNPIYIITVWGVGYKFSEEKP